MRIVILTTLICFNSFNGKTQGFDQIWNNYKSALKFQDNIEIAKNGLIILEEMQKEKIAFDSIVFDIRWETASSFSEQGNFEQSLRLNIETKELIIDNWGKENKFYPLILSSIAIGLGQLGRHHESINYGLEALQICEKNGCSIQYGVIPIIQNIATSYTDIGEYSYANIFFLKTLKLMSNLNDKEDPLFAILYANLSRNYTFLQEYSKALFYASESLKISVNTVGKTHLNYATSLNQIGGVYSSMGDIKMAIEYDSEALDIIEQIQGSNHIDYAAALNNLALDYTVLGEYAKAQKMFEDVLMLFDNKVIHMSAFSSIVMNNIALCHMHLGDYSKSLEFNRKALLLYESIYGRGNKNCAFGMYNVAEDYRLLGDNIKAREVCLEALKIIENTEGKNSSIYTSSLFSLGLINLSEGNLNESKKNLIKSYSIKELLFKRNKFGIENNLLAIHKNDLENSFSILSAMLQPDSLNISFLARSWINLNCNLNSNSHNIEMHVCENRDSSVNQKLNEYKLKKKQLLKYYELTFEEKEQRGINQQVLEDEITALERELSKKSQAFADFNRYFYTSHFKKELEVNEFFVDIARIPYYSFYSNLWTDTIKYIVFITDSKDTLVDYLFIDNGLELEKELISDYNFECSQKKSSTDFKNEIFYNSFWKPIADKIGDAKTIYVSLGGVYNNINLNTLYNPETGKYLLEEKDIRIVNSARDFVLSKEQEKKIYTTNTAALFGFPDFNGNTTVAADSTDFLASTRDLNSFWLDSLTRGGLKANPLPATKIEVENISLTLKSKGWQVNSYLAENASETNIKKQESPRILHIATHGYFFPDIPIDKDNTRFLGMDRQQVVQDPMLRSGLLFTGANRTLKGEESKGENGLLSAAEASLLDLRETELVVLSACETGKGEVKNSEGVYGLRKAFSDAGAKNIIMSLWKVDDKVTQEFMSRFYEIWLNDKTSIREAFNKTQLEIKAKYPQPYYWGAFILVGE